MAYSGVAQQVFECVKCEKIEDSYSFSSYNGGLLCDKCRSSDNTAIRLSTSSVYTLQYIMSKDVEKLYTFRVSFEVLNELIVCAKRYLAYHLNYEFKSGELLKSL